MHHSLLTVFSTLKKAAGRRNKSQAGSRQVLTHPWSDTRPVICSLEAAHFWGGKSSAALPVLARSQPAAPSALPAVRLPGSLQAAQVSGLG